MELPWFFAAALLACIFTYGRGDKVADREHVSRLKHDLLVGYDPFVLPKTGKNATQLVITLHPQKIDLDEKTSTFTLTGVLVMGWIDERIKWDPAQYGDERYAFFDVSQLWKPELTVYNNAATKAAHQFGKQRMVSTSSGSIYWSPVVKFQTACTHNLKNWPFDSTQCTMRIGSWAHSGDDLFMELWNPDDPHLNLTDLISNPNWDVQLNKFGIRNEVFQCCPSFQEFYVDWQLTRRYVHPIVTIFVPAIAIAWMVLITFWMNPKSPERSGLLFTAFIVNFWFLRRVYTIIPPNGDDVPVIISYFRHSLVMICAALIWTICSRHIAQTRRMSKIPLPAQLLGFLESWPSKVLFIAPRPQDNGNSGVYKMTEEDPGLTGLHSLVNSDWAWLAHLLDRIMFGVYVVLYFIFVIAYL